MTYALPLNAGLCVTLDHFYHGFQAEIISGLLSQTWKQVNK